MLNKRVIPCLDVNNGRVVKGTSFVNLRDAGNPVELAARYYREGADELVFLDISATTEERKTMAEVVEQVSKEVFIPLCVGGGLRSIADMNTLLRAGADKVSINSAAVSDPDLISRGAEKFGRQCIVVAIDAKREGSGWQVYTHSGKKPAGLDAVEWAIKAEALGAGEILLTSIDADGKNTGYDNELNREISSRLNIPVIASGGAGGPEDLYNALDKGQADAVLAASIFHYGRYTIAEVKQYLKSKGLPVRLEN
ncbi:MAG: imidazole glycerol phosphate synthase subunit HisF [Dehalococcoides mccartyi]|jgi:imidazoleglycerol phosphate synthase, cyclase subunit|uniref:Imidazole glycerol phosphate synthase subunit HisF n=2 Tax=root TaxID=1 RepID=A0AB38Z884_9CHLR|nr:MULTISPECIES: imidazole glycerol phosphate synthase subunit HisF [Dehalococcoides]AII59691.1 imidazole glycerol phosphate synthase [Dehalococcoides mccartyi CG4]MBF4482254.1 imidazole glycerol phosphate synthase subunit HisF [Dehalococcoides mccartyi]MBJ7531828.1 imidazole glycerol phosphate synthase subunit HisF [Dehalococcoides mccartyi]MEA4878947.1 imidazole glycerol phosphate synthase subunit HisF [Dehalococcoides mccartyi]OBW61681.1 MAG: imidazole glycerol phosphate synthase subunit Hi